MITLRFPYIINQSYNHAIVEFTLRYPIGYRIKPNENLKQSKKSSLRTITFKEAHIVQYISGAYSWVLGIRGAYFMFVAWVVSIQI